MNSKERFLSAARNNKPDRVPVFANLTPQIAEKLGKKMNLPYEPVDSLLSTRISHTKILLELGNDAVGIGPSREIPTKQLKDGRLQDEFGIIYKRVGLYDEAVARPLSNVESIADLETFKMPDPLAESRYELAEEMVDQYADDYAIVGDLEATIFELAWNLVGLDKFLMDLSFKKYYIFELINKIVEFNKKIAVKLTKLGSDMLWLGDDFGTQKGMMINPDLYRDVFKPKQREIIKAVKNINPDIIIAYHSCGSIRPIINDLIEIGVEVLNPIQPRAKDMNLQELKNDYSDKIAFFGTIDVQDTLPNGTVQDVKQEVKLRIEQGAAGGGLILAPAHNIQADTPLENIYAMFDAIKEYGVY